MEITAVASTRTVLVVDDDVDFLNEVRLMLVSNDVKNVMTLNTSRDLLGKLEQGGVGILLMDWIMPEMSGSDLLPVIVQQYPHIPVIIMTAVNDLRTVVGCIKQGAFEYITKPIDVDRILLAINKAFQFSELSSQNQRLKDYLMGENLGRPEVFADIVTCNQRMLAIFKIIETMGGLTSPVLITGETGVGKELIARAIHQASGLSGEFVPLNVAGLSDLMLDDTLFGHKKGAYTGADTTREGLIAKAQGGTLFLDEIGDMGSASQVKLLRLLQEREYYRLGSDALIKSDARIIAASNCNFNEMLEQGKFRRDLYHRLCGYHIRIPPLRERRDDIPLLINHFLQTAARKIGRKVPLIDEQASGALEGYSYPGNVRELINLVHNALSSNAGTLLTLDDFQGLASEDGTSQRGMRIIRNRDFKMQMNCQEFPRISSVEQMLIEEALRITKGNKTVAADLLGISRPTLNKKIAGMEG
ncbi:MAG: two-component system response regulator [Nitrospirae bacterium GWC2_56_14]|nr:MAG: two-component system response regulator [Nitrospirae bacterium GWC2_56_14]